MKQYIAAAALAALAACGGGGVDAPRGMVAEKRAPGTGPGACGIKNAYTVREVAGIKLSRPATLNMKTAKALDKWIRNGAIPAIGSKGGGLTEITVAASYACRTRNHRRGAKLSEHAKGNAIDISAFRLANGTRITVLDDWNSRNGRILKKMHRAACGPFGTVLGPNSDRFHRDHFHFDTASHRGGPYCR